MDKLTPAETRYLKWIAHGLPNKQIAERLGIKPHTLHGRSISLFAKLNVTNRTQAALYAWRTGLVDMDEAWETVVEVQGIDSLATSEPGTRKNGSQHE